MRQSQHKTRRRKTSGVAGIFLAIGGGILLLIAVVLVLVMSFILGTAMQISTLGGAITTLFAEDEGGDSPLQCMADTPVSATGTQETHARTIIGVGKALNIPPEGQVVALMVGLQESTLRNLANTGVDTTGYNGFPAPGKEWWMAVAARSKSFPHDGLGSNADSVNVFQQRAAAGWGDGGGITARLNPQAAMARLMDPKWAAGKFYARLNQISGWQNLPKTVAAQRVQRSAFPDAYAKWEARATELQAANNDAPPVPPPPGSAPIPATTTPQQASTGTGAVQYPMREGTYRLSGAYGTDRGDHIHAGVDMAAPIGTPMYAAADGLVVAAGSAGGFGNWVVIDHVIDGKKYSTVYGHMRASSILVKEGDVVTKGQQIATVGNEGRSTGPHLHFEVWDGGRLSGGRHINPLTWLNGNHMESNPGVVPPGC